MFSRLFEERDKTITHLVKLGDCIGRSIRENVMLFSLDGNNDQVTYLTESSKVITGKFNISEDVTLKNIKVQDSSVFEDEDTFDGFVNEKMHSFIENIHYSEYGEADDSFTDILSLWENRLKLSGVQQRLQEQCSHLSKTEKIIESVEYQNLLEVVPQLNSFLQENLEKIILVPEIRNAVNLSNAVSEAFDFPRMTLEDLSEQESYSVKRGANESIYEMVCRQELIKKEIIESKRNFEMVWASAPTIKNLASMIFEDAETTVGALSEALVEVPYLALASKKSLFETFSNCLASVDGALGVTEKDIQEFSSKIFEYKKDVKEVFISNINEKYGVNIQNLQDPASFKSLANTQVVIFEALSRLAPKGSVLKGILSEMAQGLKGKHGVECIDINDFLLEMFVSAGYEIVLEEGSSSKIDFRRITGQLSDIKNLVNTIQEQLSEKDAEYESDENLEDVAESVDPDEDPNKATSEEEAMVDDEEQDAAEEEEAMKEPEEQPKVKTEDEAIQSLADIDKVVQQVVDELGSDFDIE
tara:strand:+ start:641 stop:2227 length:1587 start_codon:yes stop_codon:yes gene_type:complete